MPIKTPVYLLLASCLLVTSVPAAAHHSVSGQFDRNKRVELTGVITKIDWINPHTYVHLEVRDANGAVTMWQLESLPTAMLRKVGLTKEMLMGDGAPVTVAAIQARDGSQHLGWLLKVE
jgi:hypothetical protein